MTNQNPFEAPRSAKTIGSQTNDEQANTVPSPGFFSGLLLLTGIGALMLLDGQVFRNLIVFLVCVAFSAMLWFSYRLKTKQNKPSAGRLALIIHLILLVAMGTKLPNAFQRQRSFNQSMKRIRSIRIENEATAKMLDPLPPQQTIDVR